MTSRAQSNNRDPSITLLPARIAYGIALAVIGIWIAILVLIDLLLLGPGPMVPVSHGFLVFLTGTLAVASVVSIVAGLKIRVGFFRRSRNADRYMTSAFICVPLFLAPPMFGLILGLMSTAWALISPFFAAGVVALVLTFPMAGRQKKNNDQASEGLR